MEMMMSGGMPKGGRRGAERRRYVDDDDEARFKTRGFFLRVVMDHRKVPELLVQLTNSRWPVQILRVHQQDLHEDEVAEVRDGRGGRTRMSEMMMGSGRFGGSMATPRISSRPKRRPRMSMSSRPDAAEIGPGETFGEKNLVDVAASAMADPYLAEVVIAGLFTLYMPPEGEAKSEGEQTGGTEAQQAGDQRNLKPDATGTDSEKQPATEDKTAESAGPGEEPAETKTAQPATETENKADADANENVNPGDGSGT